MKVLRIEEGFIFMSRFQGSMSVESGFMSTIGSYMSIKPRNMSPQYSIMSTSVFMSRLPGDKSVESGIMSTKKEI